MTSVLAKGHWTPGKVLFSSVGAPGWMTSHAALPVAHPRGDACRIYFCGRDPGQRARIGYVDVDLEAGAVLAVSQAPVLELGDLGAFDDSGVTTACLVDRGARLYLYYSGWTVGVTVPFYFYVGLAISDDGGETFQRASRGPVLERNSIDPFLTASPWVMVEGNLWRMWYVSCCRWVVENGKPKHYYHIKYAESADGLHWERTGRVCIDFASPEEYALARPCVRRENGRYKMWFSARGAAYRLGYAESRDGLTWTRDDLAAEAVVPQGDWDRQMQAYPTVFESGGARWMLFNGDGYGATGIGLSRWALP